MTFPESLELLIVSFLTFPEIQSLNFLGIRCATILYTKLLNNGFLRRQYAIEKINQEEKLAEIVKTMCKWCNLDIINKLIIENSINITPFIEDITSYYDYPFAVKIIISPDPEDTYKNIISSTTDKYRQLEIKNTILFLIFAISERNLMKNEFLFRELMSIPHIPTFLSQKLIGGLPPTRFRLDIYDDSIFRHITSDDMEGYSVNIMIYSGAAEYITKYAALMTYAPFIEYDYSTVSVGNETYKSVIKIAEIAKDTIATNVSFFELVLKVGDRRVIEMISWSNAFIKSVLESTQFQLVDLHKTDAIDLLIEKKYTPNFIINDQDLVGEKYVSYQIMTQLYKKIDEARLSEMCLSAILYKNINICKFFLEYREDIFLLHSNQLSQLELAYLRSLGHIIQL